MISSEQSEEWPLRKTNTDTALFVFPLRNNLVRKLHEFLSATGTADKGIIQQFLRGCALLGLHITLFVSNHIDVQSM